MTLALVQLIPVTEAKPGTISTRTPTYDAKICAGCPMATMCKARGSAKAFRVGKVRGAPRMCRRLGAPLVPCEAENVPTLEEPALRRTERPKRIQKWLVDASVFINARKDDHYSCNRILDAAGARVQLATTRGVYGELQYDYRLPVELTILEDAPLDPQLVLLAAANATPAKKASRNDLSLIQALLDHPEYAGIIVQDHDVLGIHPASFIRARTGRIVEVLTSSQFMARHRSLTC
jgi:hypothetical protein